jgi:DNA-binding LacI/PurR family transcriptional regulator
MNYQRITIKDIARAAGLTPSSVSRALNNHPRISRQTKEKVLALARKMGYSPNLFARGLVKKKTYLIGLQVYDFRNPFYAELTRAIQDTAQEFGYWVIQASTDDDRDKTEFLVDSMIKMGVEGIIFASCKLQDKTVEKLIDTGFPVVLANRRLKKDIGDYVVLDNTYGAYLMVNHLINHGYRRIAMISGPRSVSTSADRDRGYRQALKDRGLSVDGEIIKYGSFSQETGFRFAKQLMALLNPPQAIFCGDDAIALGAMKALGEVGRRVPDDVAVVGFDDAEISSHPLIQLTTVSQNLREMGRIAARTMVDRIEGRQKNPQRILIEPHLIIRRSCGYNLNPKAGSAGRPAETAFFGEVRGWRMKV